MDGVIDPIASSDLLAWSTSSCHAPGCRPDSAPLLRDVAEADRFAAASGQREQHALVA